MVAVLAKRSRRFLRRAEAQEQLQLLAQASRVLRWAVARRLARRGFGAFRRFGAGGKLGRGRASFGDERHVA